MHVGDGGGDPEGEGADGGHRHDHDHQSVAQSPEEDLIRDKLFIVSEADEDIHRVLAHVGVKEAGVDAHEHRVDNKGNEKEQARQEEEIAGDGLPPHQGPAQAGIRLTHTHELPSLTE